MNNEMVKEDSTKTTIDILIETMDLKQLITDEEQRRGLMNVLTILQAGHLLDIFKMQSAMSEYMRLAIDKLYDSNKIVMGEESEPDMMNKLMNAMTFMQKYMAYAQKFTHGNQELLMPKVRKENEEAIIKLLATLQGDQLQEVIQLLERLNNGENLKPVPSTTGITPSGTTK